MTSLLMPKATAVWLIDNTTLTFEQIAEFCSLHVLEVQAIADGDVGHGILGFDPILNGQLTQEEIDKCCNDTSLFLTKSNSLLPEPENHMNQPVQGQMRFAEIAEVLTIQIFLQICLLCICNESQHLQDYI